MYARNFPRFLAGLLALAMLATSCGSGTDSDTAAEDTSTSTTAVASSTTAVAASVAEEADDDESMSDDESVDEALDDDVMEDDTTDDSTPTDDDVDDDTDQSEIESVLGFFGVEAADTASVATCAIETAEAEGMSKDELVESSALFFVLLDCAPEIAREGMRDGFADIDSSGLSATPEQIECTFDATLDFFATIPLAEIDSVSDADVAPQELVDALIDTCDISQADADALLNDF